MMSGHFVDLRPFGRFCHAICIVRLRAVTKLSRAGLPARAHLQKDQGYQGMSDSSLGVDAPSPRRSRLDSSLNIILLVALIAVLAIGAIFGYTIWQDRQERAKATPALRTINELEGQVAKGAEQRRAPRVRLGEAYASAGMAAHGHQAAQDRDEARPEAHRRVARPRDDRDEREEVPRSEGLLHQGRRPHERRDFQNVNNRRENALYGLGMIALETQAVRGRRREVQGGAADP